MANRFSIGVGGRVFGVLALNGLVAMAIGLGAYVALGSLHEGISDVTSRQFPAVVASAKLERQHQRIMRGLEQLALSKDNLSRATLNQALSDLFTGYDLLLGEFDQEDGRLAIRTATLKELRDEIVRIRQTIDQLVERRIEAGNAVRERTRSLQQIADTLNGSELRDVDDEAVQRWLAAAQRVLFLLASSHRVDNPYALTRLAGEAARDMERVEALSAGLPPEMTGRLHSLTDQLRPIAVGDAAIFRFRKVQLDSEESLRGMVDRANQVSLTNTGLNTAIFGEKAALAEERRQDIIASSVNYTRVFFASVGMVLLGGGLSFLYIRRKVVARLWNTREAVRSRAMGNDTEIPAEGADEIGELARALRFYIHETEVKSEQIRKNSRWLRAVLDSTPVPLVISGQDDGLIRFVNRSAASLFCPSDRDKLLEEPVVGLWSNAEAHDEFIDAVRHKQHAFDVEAELKSDSGKGFWGLLSGLTFQFQDEAVFLISVVDITRRREAEGLLLRTQAFLDAVIDNVPSVLFVLDGTSGRVVVWNHAAERAFGSGRERIHGRRLTEALGPEIGSQLWHDGGSRLEEVEEIIVGQGGERRIFAIQRHPFEWSDDGRDHIICIANDVTQSRRAQEELRQAKERAERADLAKTEFLATVSHEMRTPLNGILGLARLLVTGSLNRAEQRHAQSIMRCGMTLLDHVNDILDLRKIEDGKLDVEPTPCLLKPLLDDVLVTVESLADEKAIALRLIVQDDVPPAVVIDQQRLRQILINLVGNAVKFTERGGVEVLVSRVEDPAGDRLRVSVRDTGIGIPEHRQTAVFDKLEQADATIARRFGGSGLGLAIVRHVVEAMGGTIAVDSEVGVGSTFTIEVALTPAPAEARPVIAATGSMAQPLDRSLRLLLVEDQAINQEIAFAVLGDAGHRLTLAETGETAFELAATRAFDAILLDIRLPDIDGAEVARRIRRLPDPGRSMVPIIALTANVFVGAKARYMDAGIDAVVEKPLFPERLIQVLSNVMAGRRPKPPPEPPALSPAGLLDPGILERYFRSLGPRRFALIKKALLDTVAEGLPVIAAETAGDGDLLETAHHLAGAASHFGLARFVETMRAIEDRAAEGQRAEAMKLAAGAPGLFAATLAALDDWCARHADPVESEAG